MSADSKRSCLNLFADGVKKISPTNVTGYRCKAFYNTGNSAHRREHGGKLQCSRCAHSSIGA